VGWYANQYCIAIVESRVYQSNYERLERGCRHRSADLAQLAESSEALRDVYLHRQVCITVNVEMRAIPFNVVPLCFMVWDFFLEHWSSFRWMACTTLPATCPGLIGVDLREVGSIHIFRVHFLTFLYCNDTCHLKVLTEHHFHHFRTKNLTNNRLEQQLSRMHTSAMSC